MNNVRIVTFRLLRTYVTKPPPETAGIRGRIKLSKLEGSEFTHEECEDDDLDAFESDFTAVGQSYTDYQRELQHSKNQLKQHILKKKYFKEVHPSFLTYVEKDQIKKLHRSNPEEWTVEKLSESFPALPETIRTILKIKWVPKSADIIIKYDSKVIENWKNWKTGKLVLDPALNEHLMKFKYRKISLTDRETLNKQFIPPKMEFSKPKSTMFSDIVQDCTNREKSTYNETQSSVTESSGRDENRLTAIEKKSTETSAVKESNFKSVKNYKQETNITGKKVTFNEFLKEKLNQLYEVSPEEGITLLHTYRKHIESINSEDVSSNVSNTTKKQASVEEKSVAATKNIPDESALTINENANSEQSIYNEAQNSATESTGRDEDWLTAIEKKSTETSAVRKDNFKSAENDRQKTNIKEKLTFNEFMKVKLNQLYNVSPEEGITLLHTYRKHTESINAEDVSSNVSNDIKKQASVEEKSVAVTKNTPDESALTINRSEGESTITVTPNAESSHLDTYIKLWNSSIDTKVEYAKRIRIPENIYKEGMTYRIKDCYYDDDGEFLYRVPGLRS